jgi:uncharacterized membrane protein YdbT with pleckstrin-like domain
MNYIQKTLLPNEKLVFFIGPHYIIFYPCIIWLIAAIGFMLYLPQYPLIAYAFVAIAIYSLLSSFVTYSTSEYGITDKRILMKVGFIRRTSLEIFFNKIESIQVKQGILGRILDYGAVVICGTGGSKDPFFFIPDPLDFRKRVQEQMEKSHLAQPAQSTR